MFKNLVKELLCLMPLSFRVNLKFYLRNKYFPKINSPLTFNEKITNRKLFDNNELYVLCADKYKVREYVANKIGFEYLIPLAFNGVDLNPNLVRQIYRENGPCVFKLNHNSGGVFFVRDVENIDLDKLCSEIKRQYNRKYGKYHDEIWYDNIVPAIIAEKLILNQHGNVPEDYKFHIFNNKGSSKVVVQVDYDRFSGHNRTFYAVNGDLLPYVNKYPNKFKKFENREKLAEMLPIALKLAQDFDYVRVDLYYVDNRIYFGELTFSHGSGLDNFNSYEEDLEWGNFWSDFKIHGY